MKAKPKRKLFSCIRYAVVEETGLGVSVLDDGDFVMEYYTRGQAMAHMRIYRGNFTSNDLRGRKIRVAKLKVEEVPNA